MWNLVLKTKKYSYWYHSDGYYNCTSNNNFPQSESGYFNLAYLLMMKNDENIVINGYNIKYNSMWHKWQLSHEKIGYLGEYINIEDAIRDAKKG